MRPKSHGHISIESAAHSACMGPSVKVPCATECGPPIKQIGMVSGSPQIQHRCSLPQRIRFSSSVTLKSGMPFLSIVAKKTIGMPLYVFSFAILGFILSIFFHSTLIFQVKLVSSCSP